LQLLGGGLSTFAQTVCLTRPIAANELIPKVNASRPSAPDGLIYEAKSLFPEASLTSPANTLNASPSIPDRAGMIIAPSSVSRKEQKK